MLKESQEGYVQVQGAEKRRIVSLSLKNSKYGKIAERVGPQAGRPMLSREFLL